MAAKLLALSICVTAIYVVVALAVTRLSKPASGPVPIVSNGNLPRAGHRLSIVTWNLGYAGLGAESDFVADGGTHFFPPSRAAVKANLAGIRGVLDTIEADVFLLQEVAVSSPFNYWVNVHSTLAERFAGSDQVFGLDIETKLLPPPLRLAHGIGIYSAKAIATAEQRPLPQEETWMLGAVRKAYSMQIARLPIAGGAREWVIVNVHLAAFDDNAEVRRRQLDEVLRFGVAEHARGHAVIIGGDFNQEFVRDRFPHRTEEKYRFWLHDFPFDELSPGWSAAYDPARPTVRTVHAPYETGLNYTTVVDGFIVSPNVIAERVTTIDTSFTHSDHQPVIATFSRK